MISHPASVVQTLLTTLTQTRKPVIDGIIVHALRAYP